MEVAQSIAWRVKSSFQCRQNPVVWRSMIVTGVFPHLKFGHQKDARRDACYGDKTSFDPNSQDDEALYFLTEALELDQCLATLRMSHLMKRASVLLFVTIPKMSKPNKSVPNGECPTTTDPSVLLVSCGRRRVRKCMVMVRTGLLGSEFSPKRP